MVAVKLRLEDGLLVPVTFLGGCLKAVRVIWTCHGSLVITLFVLFTHLPVEDFIIFRVSSIVLA